MGTSRTAHRAMVVSTGVALAGLLAGSPIAAALPPFPLAPACTDYIYPSSFEFTQDNGILVAINNNGNRFDGGGASYTLPGSGVDTRGISTGSRNGRTIDINVNWNNGFSSHITGRIDDDLVARGTSVNNQGATNTWTSLGKFRCIAPSPTPAPAPVVVAPPEPADPPAVQGTAATITEDTDVFDIPGGVGNVIGVLRKGAAVRLLERANDNWCKVSGDGVPGGTAFVFGDFVA